MATKYKEYKPDTYVESEELKNAGKTAEHWNKQQLQNFTFGEQDLSQDYLDTSNALKNLVKPTWEGYSKQGDWDSIYDQLANMKDFSYDVNGDALYQQYKDQYVTGGKMAMMDTMGQAAAMTGGYGNSYAQSVGQQAYQGYLQQLNDKVPELYQLALAKYNSDKDNLYRMNDLHQNMFSNEYGMYRDTVSDYNTDRSYLSGRESELYGRDYSKKYDEVTSLNSNIVNERTNANDVYNALKTSEWGRYMDNETLKKVAIEVANENLYKNVQEQQANASLAEQKRQFDENLRLNTTGTATLSDGTVVKKTNYGNPADSAKDVPKYVLDKVATFTNNDELHSYLDSLESQGIISQDVADSLYETYKKNSLSAKTWTLKDDGGINWFGGRDNNAVVSYSYTDEQGKAATKDYTLKQLYNALLGEGMSKKDANAYIDKLQKKLVI